MQASCQFISKIDSVLATFCWWSAKDYCFALHSFVAWKELCLLSTWTFSQKMLCAQNIAFGLFFKMARSIFVIFASVCCDTSGMCGKTARQGFETDANMLLNHYEKCERACFGCMVQTQAWIQKKWCVERRSSKREIHRTYQIKKDWMCCACYCYDDNVQRFGYVHNLVSLSKLLERQLLSTVVCKKHGFNECSLFFIRSSHVDVMLKSTFPLLMPIMLNLLFEIPEELVEVKFEDEAIWAHALLDNQQRRFLGINYKYRNKNNNPCNIQNNVGTLQHCEIV